MVKSAIFRIFQIFAPSEIHLTPSMIERLNANPPGKNELIKFPGATTESLLLEPKLIFFP